MELVIAIISFLTGFLVALYFAYKSQQVNFINDHIPDIEFIEECALTYWLSEPVMSSSKKEIEIYRQKNIELETKLRGAFFAQILFYNEGSALLGIENFEKYKNLTFKLEDEATGGSFETSKRQIDKSRAANIMYLSYEIRTLLRTSRKKLFTYR